MIYLYTIKLIKPLAATATIRQAIMKNQYLKLKESAENLSNNELIDAISEFVNEIILTDSRLLSVSKSWSGYGTCKSVGFANDYYFGEELAKAIQKALNGKITHDEDSEFNLSDFSEKIEDAIYDNI